MTSDRRPPHDRLPATGDPAPQPKPPDHRSPRAPLPSTTPPGLNPLKPSQPDPSCRCPTRPGTSSNPLEALIASQATEIANCASAAKLKEELEALLEQARAAGAAYTRNKYDEMVKAWIEQDVLIAQLIARLVVILPCWRGVIECHVSPLLEQFHYAEQWLYGDDRLYAAVHDLHDLQYWHTRDRQIKMRRLARIENVLIAWTRPGPAATIDATLQTDQDLATAMSGALETNPSKGLYDLFFKLIPRHLAIAPPATIATTTIDRKYTTFGTCDAGEAADGCGPDVGKLTAHQRLVGLLPYLIDPAEYFPLVATIVEQRFVPARDAAAKAEMDLAAITARMASLEAQIGPAWPATFEADASGGIPGIIACGDYGPRDGGRPGH
jgi:hypothetical protein